MMMKTTFAVLTAVAVLTLGGTAFAQSDEAAKTVGHKGATQLGFNFSTNTSIQETGFGSTTAQTSLFGGFDVGRFATDKFLVRFGFNAFGQLGGGSETEFGSFGGSSVSFGLLGGGLYYLTPQKAQSLYLGGDMSVPLSSSGAGSPYANGRLGVQAAIRSNAAIFLEAGYGALLSSAAGSTGSLQSNLGVRVLF
jgi:hypothetical protein